MIIIKSTNLSEKEQLFCCYFSELSSVLESALAAGYPKETAFIEGTRILENPKAIKFIRKQREILFNKEESSAEKALRRIAFSNPQSTVNSVISEDADFFDGDCFCISEIKKVKGGGAEIKFVNKLDALKLLYEIEDARKKSDGATNFFSALQLESSGDNDEV